ncbi:MULTISPECIES: GNAT family N-acetyltransferase [unclassified Neisseria]|uniref:GNAT family N-acetyltransferase n=1 Tax=unclassified Neisseria TaxID=2623750 RepID=UPI002666590E|nr:MULTISPECIES: GNAT family N-acetyltransferase [unclassified Neisseria]MDO1510875.1 GNAT family N-acetyltransferase [Neisseria sp. MVDL19-042950]MDO1517123.1 GNAT family N-acetyltransferase [Neisseria sp. MVDL18-041461]MDO1564486.1 GNAT family N-acetyltransferase [Neisseria sp. MVDL20-010259]
MLVCNPYEIVIHGTTSKGKIFRPSDWAERLCGILSSFDKGNRLSYHQWVRPILVDKVRCVAVDKKLEEINPPMFRFLMDFAADNDLRVMDCKSLLDERSNQDGKTEAASQERVLLAKAIEEKQAAEQRSQAEAADMVESVLREIGADETATAFAALSVLRPTITDVNRFVEQVNTLQRNQGYRLLGIFEEGKANAVAVCGFREEVNLASGRHIHIDDIVTIPQARNRGYAERLLAEVHKISKDAGIRQIHIDANVGCERTSAHRLYFKNGFEIGAHHFVRKFEAF